MQTIFCNFTSKYDVIFCRLPNFLLKFEKSVDQTTPTFSGADVFFSRRKQKITLEKDPKLAINGPKQPAALASPNPVAANSNFFIPASLATPTKGLQEILENDIVGINYTIYTFKQHCFII